MDRCGGTFRMVGVLFVMMLLFQLGGCVVEWPISKEVHTTTEQQVLPVAVSPDTPQIKPSEVSRYVELGYSAWIAEPGTNYSTDAYNAELLK